jgi:hypothetical protein
MISFYEAPMGEKYDKKQVTITMIATWRLSVSNSRYYTRILSEIKKQLQPIKTLYKNSLKRLDGYFLELESVAIEAGDFYGFYPDW